MRGPFDRVITEVRSHSLEIISSVGESGKEEESHTKIIRNSHAKNRKFVV